MVGSVLIVGMGNRHRRQSLGIEERGTDFYFGMHTPDGVELDVKTISILVHQMDGLLDNLMGDARRGRVTLEQIDRLIAAYGK